ncbi:MAG: hypothetical protein OXH75_27685 [Acidobacteria bacterium]|nr:hypothetical protein [Acidobacteriota bacterium]
MAKRADAERPWKCLSVRQPYAWAIIKGAKDIENRDRMSYYVGRLYIHAGKKERTDRIDDCVAMVAKHFAVPVSEMLDDYHRHVRHGRGAIIGSVHMFGCARHHESAWFTGKYGYMFRDPKPLRKPIPCDGSPSFFNFTP